VAAAARCFAAAGYDATSVRHVAAEAGVDPALVRRFFGGKDQLFTQVASALIDPERALAAVTVGPPEAAAERLLRYFLSLLGDVAQPGPTRYAVRLAPLTAADDGELADWVAPVLQYYLTGVPYRLKEQP
jgi:AcrR family transcriptional regulator